MKHSRGTNRREALVAKKTNPPTTVTATVVRNDRQDPSDKIARRNGEQLVPKGTMRLDGWFNLLTGMGVKGKDKRMSTSISSWKKAFERELEDLYAMDDMIAKIIDLPVDEATKKGWNLKGLEPDQLDQIYKREKDLGFREKFKQACIDARLYGGEGLVLFNGDARLDAPMRAVRTIVTLTNLNRFELYCMQQDLQRDITEPNYGEPEFYTLQPRDSNSHNATRIHSSRVIRFDGVYLPGTLKMDNGYWGDSVVTKIYDKVRDYNSASSSLAQMLDDVSVAVWKIKGLADQIAGDGEAAVAKRMEIANLSRQVARAMLLDAEGEEFDFKARPVTGVAEVMAKVENRLVAGTPFPHTVLFGNSPSGMGGSGRHEQDNWYDYVRSYQTGYQEPKLLQFYGWLCDELSFDKSKLEIEFNPLYQEDETTMADRNFKQAQADQINIQEGILSPEEIRKARFEGDGFTVNTQVESEADVPLETPPAGTAPEKDAGLQAQALNGAQVTSLLEILTKVGEGNLPKSSAKVAIKAAFPVMTDIQINGMIDPIVEGSVKPEPTFNSPGGTP